jgi:hypothetical protein
MSSMSKDGLFFRVSLFITRTIEDINSIFDHVLHRRGVGNCSRFLGKSKVRTSCNSSIN